MVYEVNEFVLKLEDFAKSLNDKDINYRLARKCKEIIYRRTKNGYGVDNDRSKAEDTRQVKLKELSASYIAQREGKLTFLTLKDGRVIPINLAAYGKRHKVSFRPKLGPFGRPRKSNATFTGDMMEAIFLRATNDGFHLLINNDRRADGKTNRRVAEYYSEDRPFFALTAGEVRILTREMEKIIKELITKKFG